MPYSKARRVLVICLIGLAIEFALALYLGLIPAYAEICEYNQHTDKEKCASYNLLVYALLSGVNILDRYAGLITALATGMIGLYTRTLFKATVGLKDLAAKQASDMTISLDISRESADAAKKAAEVAEISLIQTERPYLVITNVSAFLPQISESQESISYFVNYHIANHGKTPAIIERIYADISVCDNVSPPFPIHRRAIPSVLNEHIIAPRQSIEGVREYAPPDIVFRNTAVDVYTPQLKGEARIYLWIAVRYRGVFSKGHESSFCWIFSGNTFIPYGDETYN